MLRTSIVQDDSPRLDRAAIRRYDPAISAMIERSGHEIRDCEPLAAAVDRLLDGAPWGVPIVDQDGVYCGCCTLRSIASLCLLINGETAALLPTLAFLHDDLDRIRRRLGAALATPVRQAADPFVPTVRSAASLPEIFFHFYRGHALLPVVEDETRRYVGVIRCERVLLSVLDRSAIAAGR